MFLVINFEQISQAIGVFIGVLYNRSIIDEFNEDYKVNITFIFQMKIAAIQRLS